jgi:multiple sugar transport system substrate-binding protein
MSEKTSRRSYVKYAGAGVVVVAVAAGGGYYAYQSSQPKEVEVSYWHWDTRPEDKEAINAVITSFNAKNPDVKIALDYNPWEVGRQKMTAAIQAGTTPDTSMAADWPIWALMGALEPLDDYMDEMSFPKNIMQDDVWRSATWDPLYGGDGKIYSLPWLQCGGRCIVYNYEHFEEAGITDPKGQQPKSWDQLREYMQALKDIGKIPYGQTGSDGEDILTVLSMMLSWDKDATLSKPKGDSRECAFNTDKCAEAMDFYLNLYKDGLSNASAPTDTFKDIEYMLEAGQLSMLMMGPFTFGALDKAGVPYKVFPLPIGPERTATANCYNGTELFKNARDKEAAWKWIEYQSSEEGQYVKYIENDHAALPTNLDVIADPKLSSPGSKFMPFLQILTDADFVWSEQWEPAYGGTLTTIFDLLQKGYVGDITAKDVVQGWADAWNKVITG